MDDLLIRRGFRSVEMEGGHIHEYLDAVAELRSMAWANVSPSTSRSDCWKDTLDILGLHFLVMKDSELVAAARMHIFSDWNRFRTDWFNGVTIQPTAPFAYLSCLVVHPNYQTKRLGTWLDQRRLERATSLGARSALCDVPDYRVEHMKRLGFAVVSRPQPSNRIQNVEFTIVYCQLFPRM